MSQYREVVSEARRSTLLKRAEAWVEEHNTTMGELSRLAGVSPGPLYNASVGRSRMKLDVHDKIKKVLDTSDNPKVQQLGRTAHNAAHREEIERRRLAAEQARAEHVRYWLEKEREGLNGRKRSGMVT